MSDFKVGGNNYTNDYSFKAEGAKGANFKDDVSPDVLKFISGLSGPNLKAPEGGMPMSVIAGLSEEALMSMLGMEERKSAVTSGLESLRAKAEERREINQQKIELLQEQAEKAEENKVLAGIKKAFSIIGAVVGTIASIGSIVAGFCSANPLLVIGGALTLVASIDSMVSTATDGENSIASAVAKSLQENNNLDESAAKWIGVAVSMTIGITGAVMTGVGAYQLASEASTSVSQVNNIVSAASSIASGVVQTGQGAVQITEAVLNYKLSNLKADSKELEAILQRIQAASDIDIQLVESNLEKTQSLTENLKKTIEDCRMALNSILTGAPAAV